MSNQERNIEVENQSNFESLESDMLTRKNTDQTKGGLSRNVNKGETQEKEKGTSTTEIG